MQIKRGDLVQHSKDDLIGCVTKVFDRFVAVRLPQGHGRVWLQACATVVKYAYGASLCPEEKPSKRYNRRL